MSPSPLLASAEARAFQAQIASTFGLSEAQAAAAVGTLLPELLVGLERNTLSRGGVADLLRALASGGHQQYLGRDDLLRDPTVAADGNAILGHVLGSPGRADRIALRAADTTGLSSTILRQILPALAALVLGYLFKNGKGALGDVLSKLPQGGGAGRGSWPSGGGFGAPQPTGTGTGLPSGNAGGMGFPSGPGDNPYGDLSDILNRKSTGSGGLSGSVRDIIGGILGFQSGGWLSWIIRFIVVRWGWSILKWFVGRLFVRG